MAYQSLVLPKKLESDPQSLTDTYGRFYAEPFEKGYGHTIGNSLRRILLSSLEGAAITAVKIPTVTHEFTSLKGVKEDVADILLNLKQVRLRLIGDGPEIIRLSLKREGVAQAKDFSANANVAVLTPDSPIATLDGSATLEIEAWVCKGRGYSPSDRQRDDQYPADVLLIDTLYSPVVKVHYDVENTRVGQITDYDRLVFDVWTDGSINPQEALNNASKILRESLKVFIGENEVAEQVVEVASSTDAVAAVGSTGQERLKELLEQPVDMIELSVRASNCLKASKIRTIGDLVGKKEEELIELKNFGKKSLDEIRDRLKELGLDLGMEI